MWDLLGFISVWLFLLRTLSKCPYCQCMASLGPWRKSQHIHQVGVFWNLCSSLQPSTTCSLLSLLEPSLSIPSGNWSWKREFLPCILGAPFLYLILQNLAVVESVMSFLFIFKLHVPLLFYLDSVNLNLLTCLLFSFSLIFLAIQTMLWLFSFFRLTPSSDNFNLPSVTPWFENHLHWLLFQS